MLGRELRRDSSYSWSKAVLTDYRTAISCNFENAINFIYTIAPRNNVLSIINNRESIFVAIVFDSNELAIRFKNQSLYENQKEQNLKKAHIYIYIRGSKI